MPRPFLFALITLAATTSGCATIIDGSSQVVTFNSQPNGVKILINGAQIGVTPLSTQIHRSKSTIVLARMEGYDDQQIAMQTKTNTYFFGNFISGGLIGSTIDYASDAIVEYSPNTYYVTLAPVKIAGLDEAGFTYERKVRNFILHSHHQIIVDLANGEGEYLSSLYALLRVDDKRQPENLAKLRVLASQNQEPILFADAVLGQFKTEMKPPATPITLSPQPATANPGQKQTTVPQVPRPTAPMPMPTYYDEGTYLH
jgi:hypothetical protein